jgi:hypothetical protein
MFILLDYTLMCFGKVFYYEFLLLQVVYNYLSSKNAAMEIKSDKTTYGYIVSPGNNSTAIETALKKRNVWQALSAEKDLLSASFLWRQLNCSAKVY